MGHEVRLYAGLLPCSYMCKGAPGSNSFSGARHNVSSRHGASLECDEAKFPLKGWSLFEF
jgi:hypothetical protein